MTLSVGDITRVISACQELQEEAPPLISFVFTHHGQQCQAFLEWQEGKMLKDYILDPGIHRYLTLHTAHYSRIVDHLGVKRRLTYIPKPNDELRFLRVRPGVV